MVICPDCGKEVPKEKFCKNCGAFIENIDEPSQINDNTPATVEIKKSINYCFNCGFELNGDFKFCPNCGRNLTPKVNSNNNAVTTDEGKSTLLAIILSVLLPGLGQMYLGLDHKGAIFLIAYIISLILILILIGILFAIIIWIWALIDTIIVANALDKGEEVVDKFF